MRGSSGSGTAPGDPAPHHLPRDPAPARGLSDGRADARRRNLERLLRPKSIAAVGGRFAEEVIRQTRRLGFAGPDLRRQSEARKPGRRALPRPPRGSAGAARCGFLGRRPRGDGRGCRGPAAHRRGRRGRLCLGLCRGRGRRGARAAPEVEAAGDSRSLGPNCYGVLNLIERLALWPDEHGAKPVERGVALITQSGNIGITLTMQERALPIACVLSIGNQARPRACTISWRCWRTTRGSVRSGFISRRSPTSAAFARAAITCADKGMPLVAIKAGRSQDGARTTLAHTSSLSGADALIDAYLRRYGVVRVDSLADLLETLKLLFVLGPLPGRRIASLSCSGGDAAMVADLAAPLGLELPPLPAEARAAAYRGAGRAGRDREPARLSHLHLGRSRRHAALLRRHGRCRLRCDAAGPRLSAPRGERRRRLGSRRRCLHRRGAGRRRARHRRFLAAGDPAARRPPSASPRRGLRPMQGLPECLRAVAAATGSARRGAGSPNAAATAATPRSMPKVHRADPAPGSRGQALLCHGASPCRTATSCRSLEATAAARRIGLPVALKTAAAIAHKTEVRGVVLGLQTQEAVARPHEPWPRSAIGSWSRPCCRHPFWR